MTRAVFCLYGTGMETDAQMMVDSCKWHGYEVVQLSDETAQEIDGIDSVIRRPMDGRPPELWRYERLMEVAPPFVSLDVDVLVVKDISDGADAAFDACLTERGASDMPFNSGVFFVQSSAFVAECVRLIRSMDDSRQRWFGGQLAMREIRDVGRLKIKSLPCEEWNNSKQLRAGAYKGARALHFKGGHKKNMRAAYEEHKAMRGIK